MGWQRRTSLVASAVLVMTLFSPLPPTQTSPAFGVDIPRIPRGREVPLKLRPRAFHPDPQSADDFTFGWRPDHAYVADPVDVVTGVFAFSVTDLSVHGRGLNFQFTRYYNSADDWWPSNSQMGAGWTHNFDWVLEDDVCGRFFKLRRGDGARGMLPDDISFSNDGAPFETRTYMLVTHEGTTYTFGDPIQIDSGVESVPPACTYYYFHYRLKRISDAAGNGINLTYDILGAYPNQRIRLATITDTLGRMYSLSYAGPCGYLYRLDDPFGRFILFNTDAACTLTSATDATGRTTMYTNAGRHILTITDPDGRVRPTNTWDLKSRVASQTDGEGNVTTFAYYDSGGAYSTEVTDPRGRMTHYNMCGPP